MHKVSILFDISPRLISQCRQIDLDFHVRLVDALEFTGLESDFSTVLKEAAFLQYKLIALLYFDADSKNGTWELLRNRMFECSTIITAGVSHLGSR